MNLVAVFSYYEQHNYQKGLHTIMPKFMFVILILIALLIWIPLAIVVSWIQKLYITIMVFFRRKQVTIPN